MGKADIGVIGLAVMGENLALNLESRGYTVAVYNRTPQRTDRLREGRGAGKKLWFCYSPEELVLSLKRPRKVLLMVRAGEAVDEMIQTLTPLLEKGDILIDGGNSYYRDTERRVREAETARLRFVGLGVSGGESGALHGPSLMPGGSRGAWEELRPILESISARADDGTPCCAWLGENGAGHYVKMVHNGIEYGDMQLICEAYLLLRDLLGLSAEEIHDVFTGWNDTELRSYLIEITGSILAKKDADGKLVLDRILDTAGQKGSGQWTCAVALESGVPLPLITEAVFARTLSADRDLRAAASEAYAPPKPVFSGDREKTISAIFDALLASKIVSYAQGFALLRAFPEKPNLATIALLWRGGCIIRSTFLDRIAEAYRSDPPPEHLLLSPYFRDRIRRLLPGWRSAVSTAMASGVSIPAMAAALTYFDGITSIRSGANLLQAQRDFFGAHRYERTDAPRGRFFHTDWSAGEEADML